jgi:hypothetical protein
MEASVTNDTTLIRITRENASQKTLRPARVPRPRRRRAVVPRTRSFRRALIRTPTWRCCNTHIMPTALHRLTRTRLASPCPHRQISTRPVPCFHLPDLHLLGLRSQLAPQVHRHLPKRRRKGCFPITPTRPHPRTRSRRRVRAHRCKRRHSPNRRITSITHRLGIRRIGRRTTPGLATHRRRRRGRRRRLSALARLRLGSSRRSRRGMRARIVWRHRKNGSAPSDPWRNVSIVLVYIFFFFLLPMPCLFAFPHSLTLFPIFPLYFPDILMCIVQSVRVVGIVAVVAVAVVVKSGRLLVFELGCTALSSLILSFSVL